MVRLFSFYSNESCRFVNREEAAEYAFSTGKEFKFTYGYTWKDPTTCRKPISVEEAKDIIQKVGYLDIEEEDTYIHLNGFSEMDMW